MIAEIILLVVELAAYFLSFRIPSLLPIVPLIHTLLCVYYLLFSFFALNSIKLLELFNKKSYINITIYERIVSIIFGFAMAVFFVGIMFRYFSWQYGYHMVLSGLSLISTLVLITAFLKKYRSVTFLKNMIKRVIFILTPFLFLLLLALLMNF